MNLRNAKSYFKNLSVYFGASLVPMLAGLFANPWVAKNMSPEDYAISGYYTSFSALLTPIITFYLIQFYIKEYFKQTESGRKELYSLVAKSLIYFSGLLALLCFVALWIYIKFFNSSSSLPISPYLAMAVFALPFTGLVNLELANYRMKRETTSFFRISVANGLLGILLMVLFVVWLKLGAFGKLLAPLLCNVSVFIYILLKNYKKLNYKFDTKRFWSIIKFCVPLTLSSSLGYFTQGFDRSYLETLGNNDIYGVYIVGTTIGLYLTTFSTAISNTFQPDIYESIASRQWRKFLIVVVVQIAMISFIALTFIVLAPFLIDILTAGRYVDSTPFAQIVSLSTISSTISYIIGAYCIATDRPKLYLYTTILGSIFIVIAMPFAVRTWNYYGGAWMSVFSYLGFSIINIMLIVLSKLMRTKS